MASGKKQKELLKALKRREKNPRPKPVVAKPLTMKSGERQKFTSRNTMVLLAIEKTILALADESPDLDDAVIESALTAAIRNSGNEPNEQSEHPLAVALQQRLANRYGSIFEASNHSTLDVWVDGLRAILTSLKSVSGSQPNEKSYIESARAFVSQVNSKVNDNKLN